MTDLLGKLNSELQLVLGVINKRASALGVNLPNITSTAEGKNYDYVVPESLIDRCKAVSDSNSYKKPTIRVIHHFACSGGSLISKFLSAMPNSYLLSEVHPSTDFHINRNKPHYAPTDLVSLMRFAGIEDAQQLSEDIFRLSVKKINENLISLGSHLILRDHTHADFCVENAPMSSSVIDCLCSDYNIRNIVTIRNPIDSYLSLINNGWVHFRPSSFDEYCSRLCKMLDVYKTVPTFKFEDIVESPISRMKEITQCLNLAFSEDFIDIFDAIKVTGDSGRTSGDISHRARREYTDDFKEEVAKSEFFKVITAKFGYQQLN